MRVRTFEFDNIELKIAPLTWDESERITATLRSLPPTFTTAERDRFILENCVVPCLNKPLGQNDARWSVKRLRAELDMVTLDELTDFVLITSGLRPEEAFDEVTVSSQSEVREGQYFPRRIK